MKKQLLILAFISIAQFAFSQNPPPPGGSYPAWVPDCDNVLSIYLGSQEEVDNFPLDYPDLSVINGCLKIAGQNINNVDSLYAITEVSGSLFIGGTMDGCFPPPCLGNVMMSDLSGLQNLSALGGALIIGGNHVLTDLSGLENIDYSSIQGLFIKDNMMLTDCSIYPVCGYVAIDSSNISIANNAYGCDTLPEVQAACVVMDIEESIASQVSIYPNPAKDILYIASEAKIRSIHLFNSLGQKMPLLNETTINVSQLPRGIYIIEIETENEIFRKRLLIE